MEFLSLLSVLVIICTQGTARPADNDAKDLINNGLESLEYGNSDRSKIGKRLRLPTSLRDISSVQINGSLNDYDKLFKLVLPPSNAQNEKCQVVYDFENEMLTVLTGTSDVDNTQYKLNLSSRQTAPFSIIIKPLESGDSKELNMYFDGNNSGVNTVLLCTINFDDIQNIIFEEGVESVTSLLINFKESY